MVLPLHLGSEMFGTLTLLRDVTPVPYTAEDVEFASCLADRVVVALHLARIRER